MTITDDPRFTLPADRPAAYVDQAGTWWSRCTWCGYAIYLPEGHPPAAAPGQPRNRRMWLDGGTDSEVCNCIPEGRDHEPDVARIRVALVSCAKTKLDHAAPARDLYASPLFSKTRQYVESSEGDYDVWFVLSAKHNVLHPDQVVEPYDLSLNGMDREHQNMWAANVEYDLRLKFWLCDFMSAMPDVSIDVDIFAGARYADVLVEHLERHHWGRHGTVSLPLAGMEIGERLHWLNEQLGAVDEDLDDDDEFDLPTNACGICGQRPATPPDTACSNCA